MAQLNNSSAHRERVFLQDRLQIVKVDLEAAEKDFSEFASRNGAMDITEQDRVAMNSAVKLQGELIAETPQLEEVRQIYTDSSPNARSLVAAWPTATAPSPNPVPACASRPIPGERRHHVSAPADPHHSHSATPERLAIPANSAIPAPIPRHSGSPTSAEPQSRSLIAVSFLLSAPAKTRASNERGATSSQSPRFDFAPTACFIA